MRRIYSDDSLEDFLKQSADRFGMRPSDKVWKGISSGLNRRKRRFGWIASLALLIGSVSGYTYFAFQQSASPGTGAATASANNKAYSAGTPAKVSGTAAASAISGSGTGGTDATAASGAPSVSATRQTAATGTSAAASSINRSASGNASHRLTAIAGGNRQGASHGRGHLATAITASSALAAAPVTDAATLPGAGASASLVSTELAAAPKPYDLDRVFTDAALEEPLRNTATVQAPPVKPGDPATLALKGHGLKSVNVQFFFTPTVSYRSLSENKEFAREVAVGNTQPSFRDINDAVTHKPAIGIELGLNAKYALGRNLRVLGGLQFNMSRYEVLAFESSTPQLATQAFRGGAQTSSTSYSNQEESGREDWLQNMYLQVSAPIGLELKIAGNSHTQFGVSSTIQPTYVFSDRVYMVSNDYKNYTEMTWLMRRWNVNTSLSTYIGYSTGKLSWQVGPQVRYQLLSSFTSKYPVRENLFDYGLRIGVSLNRGSR